MKSYLRHVIAGVYSGSLGIDSADLEFVKASNEVKEPSERKWKEHNHERNEMLKGINFQIL